MIILKSNAISSEVQQILYDDIFPHDKFSSVRFQTSLIRIAGDKTFITSVMKKGIIHLPGLNGLRAIAALIVLFHHMVEGLGRLNLKASAPFQVLFGDAASRHAVNIFFVISGFLITYLLLIEKNTTNTIDIKRFYLKRTLRIWPLYFLYLLVIITIYLIIYKSLDLAFLAYYILFAGNIVKAFTIEYPFSLITHYWSLGVEQQFYLFWPAAIKYIRKNMITVFLLILGVLSFIKSIPFLNPSLDFISRFIAESRFECLIIGGLGAVLYLNKSKFIVLCFSKTVQLCTLTLILIMMTNQNTLSLFSDEIVSFSILAIMIGIISGKSFFFNPEGRALEFLGKISYGIYVIHPLVMWACIRVMIKAGIANEYLGWIFCITIPSVTILLAYLSYNLFEIRFLNIKRKYSVVPSSANSEVESKSKVSLIKNKNLSRVSVFKPAFNINR